MKLTGDSDVDWDASSSSSSADDVTAPEIGLPPGLEGVKEVSVAHVVEKDGIDSKDDLAQAIRCGSHLYPRWKRELLQFADEIDAQHQAEPQCGTKKADPEADLHYSDAAHRPIGAGRNSSTVARSGVLHAFSCDASSTKGRGSDPCTPKSRRTP